MILRSPTYFSQTHFNYALELAPAGQRATYIGLLNTISGVTIVLPTIGGWLLRTTSFGVLFSLTAAVLIVAHVVSLSLPAVRHTPAQLQPEPANMNRPNTSTARIPALSRSGVWMNG